MIRNALDRWRNTPIQVKASLSYTICSILQRCLSFITLPLFTRLLTTEQYGQYSVYSSWSTILVIFLTLNLAYGSFSAAMVRFEKDRRGYVSAVQGISVALTVLFLVVYLPFQAVWNELLELPTPLVLILVAECLTGFAISCYYEVNRFEYRYKSVVLLTLLNSVVSPLLAFILVLFSEEKGYARIIGYAAGNIIIGLILFIINTRRGGKKIFHKQYWSYALRFNIPLVPYYLSQVVFNQSDRIMISHISGTDKAGLYGVAYTLATILTFVLNAINGSYVPWLYRKISEGSPQDNRKVSNGIALLMAFLLLGVIALAPEIILILAGAEYATAMWVVPPVAMSMLLLFYSQLFINIEFYYEEKTLLVWGSIGSAVLNIILNALLIPPFGFVAAGYTTLVSYIVFAAANYFTMKVVLNRRGLNSNIYDLRALILICIVFIALSFTATILYSLPIVRYMIVAVVLLALLIKRNALIRFINETILRKSD